MKKKTLAILVLLIVTIFSCKKEITICLSSSPDIAFFAEKFNVSQSKHKVIFNYAENSRELLNQKNVPDLVIDWNINDTTLYVDYKNLKSVVGKNEKIYPELLKMGQIKGKQPLIPLSFNLPMLTYIHKPGVPEYPTIQTLEEIAQNASAANKKTRWDYSKIGFSPLWEKHSLYLAYQIFGLRFNLSDNGFLADTQSLEKAEEEINKWTGILVPDLVLEEQFRDKFLYYPGYKLLQQDRAQFYYYTSDIFFSIPPKELSTLLFSWISNGIQLPADEKILYAGIPEGADHSKGAIAFLKWLLDEENQQLLIKEKNKTGYTTFALCNGFSSLISINEKFLPQVYPTLAGRIPSVDQLLFPTNAPFQLSEAREEIISNWMVQKLQGETEWGLNIEIDKWQKQQPVFR